MLLSLKWLKTMVDVPEDLQAFCDRLDLTGTGVEGVETRGSQFDGIVIGQILTKDAHPDSDHLWVTTVDIGTGEAQQIVCGAQNFEAGDKVPVATVGTTMPEGFKIKKSKLRGVESCGMNCSARELGIGDDHSGLMILPADAKVGMPIAEYLDMADTIIDLEITPNRPDCLSMVGLAREVGAMYDVDWHYEPPVSVTDGEGADVNEDVSVTIQDADLCGRYTARLIEGVKVGPSPDWLVERITALGARPINNIVDVTNYILFELGQPLHAFDLNAFPKGVDGKHHVEVRAARANERFTTLDGVERELSEDMCVIVNGEDRTVALAGVMGGLDSEVTDVTTDVLLESAVFSTSHTSRTSRNLSLVSEASIRYERGVDSATCDEFSKIAAALIAEVGGGKVRAGVVDEVLVHAQSPVLTLRVERLRAHIGAQITDGEIETILTRLGCDISEKQPGGWTVSAPTYRPDLVREIDLYEEVLRIWGMDRVPATLPGGAHAGGRTLDQRRSKRVGEVLRACGLNETMTYSLVDADDLARLRMPEDEHAQAVELINPMSVEQSVMRRSIVPGLLRSIAYNQSHGVHNVQLYEMGTVFTTEEGVKSPSESQRVDAVMCGSWNDAGWNQPATPLDFYDGKGVVENLLRELAVPKVRFEALATDEAPWLQPGRAAAVKSGKRVLGWLGEIHPLACQAFDLEGPVVALELSMEDLLAVACEQRPYEDVPVYPAVEMDLALVVDEGVSAEQVMQCIQSADRKLLDSVRLFDVYRDDERVGKGRKSLAFSLSYRAGDRTLTSEEVEKVQEKIVQKVTKAVGAEVRG